MLYEFTCGHIGRDNEPPLVSRAKERAFIRVAELRGRPAEKAATMCPHCKSGR